MNLFLIEYLSMKVGKIIMYKNSPTKYETNRNPGMSKSNLY